MTHKILVFVVALFLCLAVSSQNKHKYSPEQFQAELEQFIASEAALTPQEAEVFFPLHREMQKRQRAIYERMRNESKIKPTSEKECKKAIRRRDEIEIELKTIQQAYHNKFLAILTASKVYDIIKAEDRFHRQKLKKWSSKK